MMSMREGFRLELGTHNQHMDSQSQFFNKSTRFSAA